MRKIKFCIYCILVVFISSICCVSVMTFAEKQGTDVTSKSAILMDYDTKTVVFEKDADKRLPIASMVKLMTILITFQELNSGNLTLDQMVETSENASGMGGSQVFIDPYVEYKLEDLLKSVIIASANDASVALAEKISGSEEAFVFRMNETAKKLGMKDTLYANSTGLPAPEQFSTARDTAVLLSEVIKYDDYHKYSTVWIDKLTHPSGRVTELVNTNKLVRYYKYCDGGKTGSTNEAGCCLAASAKQNGLRLISVVIGASNSQNRFKETTNMFNYGFANYSNKKIVDSSLALTTVTVSLGKEKEIDVYAKENFYTFGKKSDNSNVETVLEMPEKISAPVKAGEKIGTIKLIQNGTLVKEIDLVIKSDVQKLGYKDIICRLAENW